jgi:lipopolysaccharide transport system permease protein
METFDTLIKPKTNIWELNLKAVWRYRDLLRMFVFRDFVTYYKQTILGPLWFFIQPLFTAAINLFVFGNLAGLGPQGVPGFLFYMSGPILWQYFEATFIKTSSTFIENQSIFGKVYFPRLIMPLTTILSGLMRFSVQLILLLFAILYFYQKTGVFSIQREIIFFPVILLIVMIISMGFGLIVSALTTKYRDLKFLIDFGVPLFKYVTPGIATSYALFIEKLPPQLIPVAKYNPLGYLIDTFNFMMVGAGSVNWPGLAYAAGFGITVLLFGILVFNKVEKTFMDTV